MAKDYLQKLQHEDDELHSADSEDERNERSGITGIKKTTDRIAARLRKEVEDATLFIHKRVADRLTDFEFDEDSYKLLRGHKLPPTSVALMDDESSFFSGAKDGTIIRWDVSTGQEIQKIKYKLPTSGQFADQAAAFSGMKDHEKEVLALAVSSDGRYLASGGRDKLLRIWDTRTNTLVETFKGHRDAISGLSFRLNSRTLLSASFDRTVKHWNLDEMGYIETLYGHQSEVNAVDSLLRDRAVTCGRDRTVRMWKIRDESQLVFNGHKGSIDCVKMVTEDYYVSGSEDGSIALWHINKKKPALLVTEAHGDERHWISSLSVLRKTDLVASGSSNGEIMLWKAELDNRVIEHVASIPVAGYVNDMAFAKSGRFLIAAVGQEHRLGRWERIREARNGICLVALPELGIE